MKQCSARSGSGAQCSGRGVWRIVLVVFPSERYENVAPMLGELPFYVCDEHKASATVNGWLTEGEWSRIRNSFTRKGLVAPDRNRATLTFRKVEETIVV